MAEIRIRFKKRYFDVMSVYVRKCIDEAFQQEGDVIGLDSKTRTITFFNSEITYYSDKFAFGMVVAPKGMEIIDREKCRCPKGGCGYISIDFGADAVKKIDGIKLNRAIDQLR